MTYAQGSFFWFKLSINTANSNTSSGYNKHDVDYFLFNLTTFTDTVLHLY